jgi:hypothetical protein
MALLVAGWPRRSCQQRRTPVVPTALCRSCVAAARNDCGLRQPPVQLRCVTCRVAVAFLFGKERSDRRRYTLSASPSEASSCRQDTASATLSRQPCECGGASTCASHNDVQGLAWKTAD